MDAPEESTTMQKPKWDRALPSSIRAVLKEYDDVFPQDLPLGLPPVHEGHEFKIDLEDEVPPVPSPIVQDEPARVGNRPKSKLSACSSTASSDHRILLMVSQSCSYPKSMGAFGFVLTTTS